MNKRRELLGDFRLRKPASVDPLLGKTLRRVSNFKPYLSLSVFRRPNGEPL